MSSGVTAETKKNFFILGVMAASIGWIFWMYIRPRILLAACGDMAVASSNMISRTSIAFDKSKNYDDSLKECLDEVHVNPATLPPLIIIN